MKVRRDGTPEVTAAGTLHYCVWPPLVSGNEVWSEGMKVRRDGTPEVTAAGTLHCMIVFGPLKID